MKPKTRLVRSYRSTTEIVEFTKSMLPGGEDIAPFERGGPKPLLTRLDGGEKRDAQIPADIAALMAEGFDSIAVITKTATESREAHESLRIKMEVKLCSSLRRRRRALKKE